MKYRLIAENSEGKSIDFYNDPGVVIVSQSGVSFTQDISSQDLVSDGAVFTNARMPRRAVSLTIRYRRGRDHEADKLRVYDVFNNKDTVRLRYVSPLQDRYIDCCAERCDTPPNAHPMLTQVSLIACEPYWKKWGGDRVLLYGTMPMFEFIKDGTDFTSYMFGDLKTSKITKIYNEGAQTGMTVTFKVKAPLFFLGIMDLETKEQIKVTDDFQTGDVLTICTVTGRKAVTLKRGGDVIDYFPYLEAGAKFIQLRKGWNRVKVLVGGGNYNHVDIFAYYDTLYGGV